MNKILFITGLFLVSCAQEKIPVNAVFHTETHRQLHVGNADGHGDNWCLTWASDDNQWTFQDDGFGWVPREERNGQTYPFDIGWSAHLWKITGAYQERSVEWVENQPDYRFPDKWFGFGLISVDEVIYATVTYVAGEGTGWGYPFEGVKMIYSPDLGKNWYLHDGQPIPGNATEGIAHSKTKESNFFWKEDPETITDELGVTKTAYAMTAVFPVQSGKDNSLAHDDYIYWYAPDTKAYHLNLARVHKSNITDRSKWEYFEAWEGTEPVWTGKLEDRGVLMSFPEKEGELVACWRGCQPSVVYNPGLDKYIMISWVEYKTAYWNGPRIHPEKGVKQYGLGMYYADKPYGPWTNFFWDSNFKPGGREYSIYNPQLSPKWISEDGTEMVMVFTSRSSYGALGDINAYPKPEQADYAWNDMKLTIQLNE